MKGTIAANSSSFDLGNAIDFLATVQRKEQSSAYRQNDYLRSKRRFPVCSHSEQNYDLSSSSYHSKKEDWEISMSGRTQVGQWFYKMTNCFGFPTDFALIAMNYFDRVLSRSDYLPGTKSEIQLLALTCFYLSVKLHQAGPILSTEQICMISGFVFNPAQVVAMEQKILRDLDWCLYPPTPSECLEPYFEILLCHSTLPIGVYSYEVLELAKEIVNDATLDYYFVSNQLLPTHIAIAALINAMLTILPISSNVLKIRHVVHILSQCTGYAIDENDVYICSQRLWETMNASYANTITESMKTSLSASISIGSDHHHSRATSPTPKSPVGVISYAPAITNGQNVMNCDIYCAMHTTTTACDYNYCYVP